MANGAAHCVPVRNVKAAIATVRARPRDALCFVAAVPSIAGYHDAIRCLGIFRGATVIARPERNAELENAEVLDRALKDARLYGGVSSPTEELATTLSILWSRSHKNKAAGTALRRPRGVPYNAAPPRCQEGRTHYEQQ